MIARTIRLVLAAVLLALALPAIACADADEAASPNATSLGLQPIRGPIPVATPAPGESKVVHRPDGAFAAVPESHGTTKVFHLVERSAPWTLKAGLTVMANTYNGVVPGPAIVVDQG
ncbi:MAG: hypothetical protein JO192_07565, partial [Candidatus Eremiobacteraeota bacterium]|nr:hypothetical protein [Candidatus Eremiobacteraeota bacterium]